MWKILLQWSHTPDELVIFIWETSFLRCLWVRFVNVAELWEKLCFVRIHRVTLSKVPLFSISCVGIHPQKYVYKVPVKSINRNLNGHVNVANMAKIKRIQFKKKVIFIWLTEVQPPLTNFPWKIIGNYINCS